MLIFFSKVKPHPVSKPSEDQLKDKLNLFLWFPLPDSVGIDSITWKSCQCLSVNVAHFKQKRKKKKRNTISTLCTDPHISLYLHSCHPGFLFLFFFYPRLCTSQCIRIPVAPSHVDISHSLRRGLGSACSLPFCGAQLLCLPGASAGVKPL